MPGASVFLPRSRLRPLKFTTTERRAQNSFVFWARISATTTRHRAEGRRDDGPRQRLAVRLHKAALIIDPSATSVWPSMCAAPGGTRRGHDFRARCRAGTARGLIFASRRRRAFGSGSTEHARWDDPPGSAGGASPCAIAAALFVRNGREWAARAFKIM